jgi:DNA-binding MarR family transcriptional regulator
MKKKKALQIDSETGEVLGGAFVYMELRKNKNYFREGWLAMAQTAAELFAKHRKELGEEGFAVLFMLIARLDFENHIVLNQAEIGREIGMARQNVQQAIRRLIGLGALVEGPKLKQSRSYKLNPEFGWKGSAQNHVKAVADHKKRMKKAGITGVIEGVDKA